MVLVQFLKHSNSIFCFFSKPEARTRDHISNDFIPLPLFTIDEQTDDEWHDSKRDVYYDMVIQFYRSNY